MKAWDNFITLQEIELGKETVDKWLRTLKVIRFDACNLYLEAKDSFQALWFEEHVRQKVTTRLFNNNNKKIKVHLAVANAAPLPKKSKKTSEKEQPQAFSLSFDDVDPHCSFKTLHVDENNLLAYKLLTAICAIADDNAPAAELGTFNPIYIHGTPGTGKTHLLMATTQALRANGYKVLFARAETFTEHVVGAIRAGEMSKFREAYRNIDVLILDDVHIFSRKGATQEELFHTFNTLHLSGRQIILSANCSPAELQHVEPRLVSRFEWGITLELKTPTKIELRSILNAKASALKYKLQPRIATFLEETFTSSPKALIRSLEALILRTHLSGSATTHVTQAHQQLEDLIREEESLAITPEKIIQTVANNFGIKPEDILGKAQSRDCVLPRQIAMYLIREKLKLPYMKIGDLFSRDHSTVMSSVRLINKGIEEKSNEISSGVETIRKKLR
ncbi:MAG: chromosomal replication initiator protein DnaA [Chlamydiales bacterium]|nr:chromosomal replication initiator protein DnaA [Chlamydiia bacterium]MCP5507197.1 chromosomal replication initiator protein DnaA [Chlamydiales bacterium]